MHPNVRLVGGNGKPVSDTNPLPVKTLPGGAAAGSVSITSVQTDADGTSYTAFPAAAARAIDIVNNSGTAIEYLRDGEGTAMPIPAGAARMIGGITDASDISVRRVDTSTTQVTVHAEVFE